MAHVQLVKVLEVYTGILTPGPQPPSLHSKPPCRVSLTVTAYSGRVLCPLLTSGRGNNLLTDVT
jgi:hypothetical protein